jgi:hypothetical protein
MSGGCDRQMDDADAGRVAIVLANLSRDGLDQALINSVRSWLANHRDDAGSAAHRNRRD